LRKGLASHGAARAGVCILQMSSGWRIRRTTITFLDTNLQHRNGGRADVSQGVGGPKLCSLDYIGMIRNRILRNG